MSIKRRFKYLWQRITRGFSDKELWNLDITIAKFIHPRLERLIEYQHGYPEGWGEQSWKGALKKMARAFEIIGTDDFWELDQKLDNEIKEGLDLFRKYYFDLWD